MKYNRHIPKPLNWQLLLYPTLVMIFLFVGVAVKAQKHQGQDPALSSVSIYPSPFSPAQQEGFLSFYVSNTGNGVIDATTPERRIKVEITFRKMTVLNDDIPSIISGAGKAYFDFTFNAVQNRLEAVQKPGFSISAFQTIDLIIKVKYSGPEQRVEPPDVGVDLKLISPSDIDDQDPQNNALTNYTYFRTDPPCATAAMSPRFDTICPGESTKISLAPNPANIVIKGYQWRRNGQTLIGENGASITVTQEGLYNVSISTETCGSIDAESYTVITKGNYPTSNVSPSNATICLGDSVHIIANGGKTYQWTLNGAPISGATSASYFAKEAGSYRVNASNGLCTATSQNSSTVSLGDGPTGVISPEIGTVCPGDSVKLFVSGGVTYQWKLNGNDIPNATKSEYFAKQAGSYSAIIQSGSCKGGAANTATVTVSNNPSGSISPTNVGLCKPDSAQLTATGGNGYQWYKNNSLIPGATRSIYFVKDSGNYTVKVGNGTCTAFASNTVAATTMATPVPSFTFQAVCINNPITFTNTSIEDRAGSISYKWDFGNNTTSTTRSSSTTYGASGKYDVKLTLTQTACSNKTFEIVKQVEVLEDLKNERYPDVAALPNENKTLEARVVANATYLWSPSLGLNVTDKSNPVFNHKKSQEYLITISNAATGCGAVDTLKVNVADKVDILVPTAFSPNKDGQNDVLRPIAIGIAKLNYFKVYDRWGQLVYQTATLHEGWDGTYNGKDQPLETYTWVLEAVGPDNAIIQKSGGSLLLR